ncbi:MAG: hypothetical protein IKC14_09330, partial [Kiritimatiellae bacterium]|nr:hypothetical protein [Kiritimatiellia bacterium]
MRCMILAAAAAAVASVFADTYATIGVEGRGLLQVEGIIRNDPKVEWGFVNFIVFGPGWQFAAQDYAAKEHKKSTVDDPKFGKGLLHTAKMWPGGRGIAIR